jgi:glycosyltransferase involved in cell wall biosynthesis
MKMSKLITEISVVIPTFRRPDLLRAAIASVGQAAQALGKDREALEILVVDDGHCECSRSICAEAQTDATHRISYMRTCTRPGRGPAVARNRGVASARGRYIYLLDDDDQFLPNRFARSLPLLRSGKYDVILERTLRVFNDGLGREPYISGPDERVTDDPIDAVRYMLSVDKTGHITPGATSFSKEIFLQLGGWDENLRFGEDGEFLLRLGAFGRVAFLAGDPVALYFFHALNSSRLENLRYYQNVKSLSHFYRNVRSADSETRRYVRGKLAQKLDFVLTAYRQESTTYYHRIAGGMASLWHYPWTCLTWNNVKSLGVWLIKARTARAEAGGS